MGKRFNEVASQRVFEVFYAAPVFWSLKNLTSIGHHSLLSKCIKTLVYINFRLDYAYIDFHIWKKYALQVSTHTVPARHMRKFNNFKEIYEKHEQICYSRLDSMCLRDCVEGLPNLGTVKMFSDTSPEVKTESGKRPILDTLSSLTLLSNPFMLPSATAIAFSRPHAAIIQGFGLANRSMQHLECLDMTFNMWEDVGRPALFHIIKDSIGMAFANLKSLSICSWMGEAGDMDYETSPISRLTCFLSATPSLEFLHLELLSLKNRARRFQDLSVPDLTGLFAAVTWRKLHILQLSNFEVNRVALTGFLERHSACLECLRIKRVSLLEKNIEDAKSRVPGKEGEAGASWECAIRYLRPIMKGLQFVDFLDLDDVYLNREYGRLKYPEDNSDSSDTDSIETSDSLSFPFNWHCLLGIYCRELAGHLLLGGYHTLPVFGGLKVLFCQTCYWPDKSGPGHGIYREPPYGTDWGVEHFSYYVDEDAYHLHDLLYNSVYAEVQSLPSVSDSEGSNAEGNDIDMDGAVVAKRS